jgi:putative lipoic acid-binding regulatory protein
MTEPTGDGGVPGEGPASSLPALEYPQDYMFKVMGLAADDFSDHVVRLMSRVVAGIRAEQVVVRASSAGKYHSATVTVRLESEAQRRAVYALLHADARVVYYL